MKNWFVDHTEWIVGAVLVAGTLALATCAHAVTQPTIEQPGPLLSAARASSTAATASAMGTAALLAPAVATATSSAQSVVLERQIAAATAATSTAATSSALSLDSLTAATDASGTHLIASLAAAQATATSTAQSKINLDALVANVNATATTLQASLAALQSTVAAVQACATSLQQSVIIGLTTGVAARIGSARLNATGTVFAEAVYPMGNFLAQVDSATLLVVSSAIAVCTQVAPTNTAHLVMRNNSNSVTVYVGGSGVTAATGIPIYPLEAFTQDAVSNAPTVWYAITAAGSADLRWARW